MIALPGRGSPSLARRERRALCDDVLLLGSDAPTLCGGWTAKDVVVHLLVRERHPLAALGILVPRAEPLTRRATERLAARDFPTLVASLREPGPAPLALPPVEILASTAELFVHHEDVRRAQDGWGPRHLDACDEDTLWRLVRVMGRVLVRPAGVPVRAVRSDSGAAATLATGSGPAVLTGRPSELLLTLFGRHAVSDTEVSGPDDTVARFRAADLGI